MIDCHAIPWSNAIAILGVCAAIVGAVWAFVWMEVKSEIALYNFVNREDDEHARKDEIK